MHELFHYFSIKSVINDRNLVNLTNPNRPIIDGNCSNGFQHFFLSTRTRDMNM